MTLQLRVNGKLIGTGDLPVEQKICRIQRITYYETNFQQIVYECPITGAKYIDVPLSSEEVN